MDDIVIVNGFTRTKHPFQIFTWIYFLQLTVCYAFVVLPNIQSLIIQIIAGILFFWLTLFLVYYAFISTQIDPTDEIVQEEKRKKKNCEFIEIKEYFCSQCDTHVSSKSKHCRVCDRCVVDFDHHCKWLNNCIGKKNYKAFFRLIVIVDFQASAFIIFSFLAANHYRPIYIWVWINDFTVGVLFFLNLNLTLFHIYLQSQHLTTYDYIIKKRLEQKVEISTYNLLFSFFIFQFFRCPCLLRNSRASVQPAAPIEQQEPQQAQSTSHRVIDVLSNHGICNEIDIQKTQVVDEILKKEVTGKKEASVEQNELQSLSDKQQRQDTFKKKVSQKLLIDQGENLQQFEQKERSESNTVNDEEQELEGIEAQFHQHEKRNTGEG